MLTSVRSTISLFLFLFFFLLCRYWMDGSLFLSCAAVMTVKSFLNLLYLRVKAVNGQDTIMSFWIRPIWIPIFFLVFWRAEFIGVAPPRTNPVTLSLFSFFKWWNKSQSLLFNTTTTDCWEYKSLQRNHVARRRHFVIRSTKRFRTNDQRRKTRHSTGNRWQLSDIREQSLFVCSLWRSLISFGVKCVLLPSFFPPAYASANEIAYWRRKTRLCTGTRRPCTVDRGTQCAKSNMHGLKM